MKLKFNANECVGCEKCTLYCTLNHHDVFGLAQGRIKLERNYPSMKTPLIKAYFCKQCPKPKCMEACPTDAYTLENGLVKLDESKCYGCGNCIDACPFHAVWMDEEAGVAFKCDTCGGDPSCVKICPHGALTWE